MRRGSMAYRAPALFRNTSGCTASSLSKVFYPARDKAGRSDLRFHDLRHTGAVYAAIAGATTADLMARLGHTTPQAAMIYQHAAEGRDALIAEGLSRLAVGDPVDESSDGAA